MTGHLCDTSVWLALAIPSHVHHPLARTWLDSLDEPGSAVFCRATQQSLLRLLTQAAVFAKYDREPLTNEQAWAVYDEMRQDERVGFHANEPPGIERYWREYSQRRTASPNLWMDAYLAAFARAADLTLVTADGDFRQFDGLDLMTLAIGGAS